MRQRQTEAQERDPRAEAETAGPLAVDLRLALGMVVFGSATPAGKIVTATMPALLGAALRVALGAVILAPFAWRHRGQIQTLSRRDWMLIGLIGLVGMFGFSALMLIGLTMISGVAGAVVMSTAPAVTAAAAILFHGDHPSRGKLLAIGCAMLGVMVLHLDRQEADGAGDRVWLGSALVFAAVCCEAAYTHLGKAVSGHVDPVLVAFLATLLALPAMLVLIAWQVATQPVAAVTAEGWVALAWYGAGTLSLGSWLWYSGLARTTTATAAGFMGLMPASGLLLSYLVLGEAFSWLHLAGFAVTFAGVLLISREHIRLAHHRADRQRRPHG